MQRSHTRSRSFKLSRIWGGNSNSSDEKPTTPATPGTFNYYAVNDPGAVNAYQEYARRQDNAAATTLTFPEERYSDDTDTSEEETVRRRIHHDRDVQMRSAAAKELQLPTRTSRESKRAKSKNCCKTFCSRFSFTTFLAFCLCFTGGGMFAVCVKLASDATMQMQQDVFHISRPWMEGAAIGLTATGALIMALSALVFGLSFVFWPKSDVSVDGPGVGGGGNSEVAGGGRRVLMRPASKNPPLVLLLIMYPALPVWLLLVAGSVAFHMTTRIMDEVCHTDEILPLWDGTVPPTNGDQCTVVGDWEDCVDCIDLYQFHFLFPEDTRKEDMWICGTEIELFCQDFIPEIVRFWLFCGVGSVLVVLGTSLHLMALTHERTRLGEERLMQEQLDLRYIQNRVSHALLSASAGSLNNNHAVNKASKKRGKKIGKEAKKQQLLASGNR